LLLLFFCFFCSIFGHSHRGFTSGYDAATMLHCFFAALD
jgi:hypothetical protein